MKALIKVTLIASAIIFTLTGCDEKKDNNKANEPTAAASTATANGAFADKTQAQKESYAIGANYASSLKMLSEQNKFALDDEYVTLGFTEQMKGKPQITAAEGDEIIKAMSERIRTEMKERSEKEKQESITAGDTFRADFAKQDGVKTTASGLLYQIITPGDKKHPTPEDNVTVNYKGTLTDGRIFDSSYARNEPATFPLGAVIPGWVEGIQLIGAGGKIKLVLPPDLAYGEQSIPGYEGNAPIPALSTLIFEVELIGINQEPEAAKQQPADDKAPATPEAKPAK